MMVKLSWYKQEYERMKDKMLIHKGLIKVNKEYISRVKVKINFIQHFLSSLPTIKLESSKMYKHKHKGKSNYTRGIIEAERLRICQL